VRVHIDEFGVTEDGRLFRNERGGNSVEVLLRRYAGCLDNQEEFVNRRIERALDEMPELEAG